MTTTAPSAKEAKVARAERSAAGVGAGKLASRECTGMRQPRSVRPAMISRS